VSVAIGVSLINIRLSLSSTSDFYITVSYERNQWSLKSQRFNTPKSNFRQSGYPFSTV